MGAVCELRTVADRLALHTDDAAGVREAEDLEQMASHLEASRHFVTSDIKYMKSRAWDSRRSLESAKELYSR
jgi:hypothetical protein